MAAGGRPPCRAKPRTGRPGQTQKKAPWTCSVRAISRRSPKSAFEPFAALSQSLPKRQQGNTTWHSHMVSSGLVISAAISPAASSGRGFDRRCQRSRSQKCRRAGGSRRPVRRRSASRGRSRRCRDHLPALAQGQRAGADRRARHPQGPEIRFHLDRDEHARRAGSPASRQGRRRCRCAHAGIAGHRRRASGRLRRASP